MFQVTENDSPTDNAYSTSKKECEEEINKADETSKLPKITSSSYVYYDPNKLPKSYREYLRQSSLHKSMEYGKNENKKGEELCYECLGKLPIATLSETVNASAICLHAWRYELAEDILFDPDYCTDENTNNASNTVKSALKFRKDDGSCNNLPQNGAKDAVKVALKSNFVKRVGKQIIFSSSIPEWALE
ncbi:unnamed protein product [Phytomonas sp. Hart1]|nr:unnamed protein product [Phytomonas sp. Hart1]|eukprot:CCW70155.1 unnamed protein product [Phytomonas sp. isolate Hart1]